MAKLVELSDSDASSDLSDSLFRAVQSSHLNFLIGAGASYPGLPIPGEVEREIEHLLQRKNSKEASRRLLLFMKQFHEPMAQLLSDVMSEPVSASLKQYADFITVLDAILSERKSNLLPRQASIFTTNYDLFIERAGELCPAVILNDGFNRIPSLNSKFKFTPERLFDATHHTGNHYDYTAELPSVNLIKLHGSMTWKRDGNDISYGVTNFDALDALDTTDERALASYIDSLAIVLPTKRKFQQTIIERTYYDLLRIFANVLERESCLLIAFGFSFRDEHILEIVKRALRNPTLLLVISCYQPEEISALTSTFASHNNVVLMTSTDTPLTFPRFTDFISRIAPSRDNS